jgi:predicted 3-demethylubiquinone-9 3-methyltransferase (glyoxalase superfamily)
MPKQVSTFLMFEGQAEEAIRFYAELLGGSIEGVEHHPEDAPVEGKLSAAVLTIAGHRIMAFDSPVHHQFTFTPATSLFVECESVEEIDRLAATLGEGGSVMMGLDVYDFARRFTWLADRFGVSWQLRLA